jgi:hypothetical protein
MATTCTTPGNIGNAYIHVLRAADKVGIFCYPVLRAADKVENCCYSVLGAVDKLENSPFSPNNITNLNHKPIFKFDIYVLLKQ